MQEDKTQKSVMHLVLLPDGNRRWAVAQGLPKVEGHRHGYQKLKEFSTWCKKRGIKVLTVFGFSTENWRRPKQEVNYLMRLLERGLKQSLPDFQKEQVKVRIIGEKSQLPSYLQQAISLVEEETKTNEDLFLNLALNYGGRWDIVQAARDLVAKNIKSQDITEEVFADYLSTAGLPEPDLVIRTSGEQRISNFLLWQTAYAELYFVKRHWPAMTEEDLDSALEAYANRQRRFGGS